MEYASFPPSSIASLCPEGGISFRNQEREQTSVCCSVVGAMFPVELVLWL